MPKEYVDEKVADERAIREKLLALMKSMACDCCIHEKMQIEDKLEDDKFIKQVDQLFMELMKINKIELNDETQDKPLFPALPKGLPKGCHIR